jgi:hypothetical protein
MLYHPDRREGSVVSTESLTASSSAARLIILEAYLTARAGMYGWRERMYKGRACSFAVTALQHKVQIPTGGQGNRQYWSLAVQQHWAKILHCVRNDKERGVTTDQRLIRKGLCARKFHSPLTTHHSHLHPSSHRQNLSFVEIFTPFGSKKGVKQRVRTAFGYPSTIIERKIICTYLEIT